MLEIDFVIETSLIALFSENVFSESLYLKGGQALRIKENLKNRFSADIDFSTSEKITDDDVFFEIMERALTKAFFQKGYALFDFKHARKPKRKSNDAPDFWGGWGVEFKLIEEKKRNLPYPERSRGAITPKGASSPKITLDISEYEYCGSVEKVKVKATDVNVYSRASLLIEKIRAICQQHPDYPFKSSSQRARDYYDIERLWSIVLSEGSADTFLKDCAQHIEKVFEAKEVPMNLLDKIREANFTEFQRGGWSAVETTVSGSLAPFDYYAQTVSDLINYIEERRKK